MKILILGATGRTGKHILTEALKRGHEVSALVRDAAKLTVASERLNAWEGLPTDKSQLTQVAAGCAAIVNALNLSRTSDFPWASLRTPKDFLSQTMENSIEVCRELGIRRMLITSAWGVDETRKEIPAWFRWLIEHSNIQYAYEEHARQEEMLRKTDLEWTIVRPAGLTNTAKTQKLQVSLNNQPKPKLTISRLSVATFLLDALEKQLFIRKCPTLSAL